MEVKIRTMNGQNIFLSLFFLLMLSFSCSEKEFQEVDLDKATKEILALHNAQRGYHFQKDSVAFANQFSDQFISVNRGLITSPSKDETISRYNSYFSSVDFVKWDDLNEPVIKFSDDGTMAYTVVDKIVQVNYKADDGSVFTDSTHFAWTAIYKKYESGWKVDCVTSTNKS